MKACRGLSGLAMLGAALTLGGCLGDANPGASECPDGGDGTPSCPRRAPARLPSPSGPPPVVAAAGDIACSPRDPYFNGGAGTPTRCRQRATSDLLVGRGYDAVLALGDNQYECASSREFARSFERSWGRYRGRMRPAMGNHEYRSTEGDGDGDGDGANVCPPGARGHFDFFGRAAGPRGRGYYSFNLGAWHVVVLNSGTAGGSCAPVRCAAESAQDRWLAADLAANPTRCALAAWHAPVFSSKNPSNAARRLLSTFDVGGGDVVLNAHVHSYERFAPQSPYGVADPAGGVRQFVVGTGGKSLEGFGAEIAPNSQARSRTFGVLELTLRPRSYDWRFVPEAGGTFRDAGTGRCH